ncbi:MAG: JAB domain-containing protein [Bacteroidales bacterium]|nr:JAB domain-containing protein [Bacteroidales bacterium]MCF8399443.1 JAB domain-containing protein [Bacteroidales bacterium]
MNDELLAMIKESYDQSNKAQNHFLAEIKIRYINRTPQSKRLKITCSEDAEKLFRGVWSGSMDHVEEFMLLCLNRANMVLGWSLIGRGGISGCVADPKIIFQTALKANASSIICGHNHPSGNLKPSESDIRLTRKLKDAGKLMDMDVLDHLILSGENYYSFADEGKL